VVCAKTITELNKNKPTSDIMTANLRGMLILII
jgi:hypothetical protein